MAGAPPRVASCCAASRDRRARARRDRRAACRRCCAASAATTSTCSTRRASGPTPPTAASTRAPAGRQRRHARLDARAHAEARAAAGASRARRRQLPVAVSGDGMRAAHRRARPSAVELVDRTMIDLARGNPAFRAGDRRALIGEPDAILLVEFIGETRDGAAAPAARSRRADGRSRAAGQRRAR